MSIQVRGYYETDAIVAENHRLSVDLPPDMPTGRVRLTIIYDMSPPVTETLPINRDIKALLAAMPPVGEDADFARQQDYPTPKASEDAIMTVTGELLRIDFSTRQVTLLYPPTRREIDCTYLPEVEDSIVETRKGFIQVTGRFVLDEEGNPNKLMDVTRVEPLDLSPIHITELDRLPVRMNEALELTPVLDEESQQYLCVEDQSLGLNAFALNRAQLLDEIQQQLAMLWTEYACASDDALDDDARALKRRLLDRMEVSRAQA
ncbi:MAG: hypothetical protein ACOYMG_26290 [Candidatus Methylumidiphilus sp.]